MTPELPNPPTGLLEHGIRQFKQLQPKPAANLDRAAWLFETRQRGRLAPRNTPRVQASAH